jgi:acyl-CoA synthetase (AMP-forming)/AMP-acid ligase II
MIHFAQLQTVHATIAFHAERQPDRAAILFTHQRMSYAELDRASNRVAHALLGSGCGRGARVAYLGKESPHYYALLFGCAKAGAVLVPINWRLAAAEVDHILRDSATRWLLVEREFVPVVESVQAALPSLAGVIVLDGDGSDEHSFSAWTARSGDAAIAVTAQPDDPIAQIYTSGTTGLPKGVVLAHRSFFKVRDALASQALDWIDWHEGDLSLVAVPGFHIGGLWWAMQGFNAGITNVVMRMFVSSDAVALIRRHRVTTTCVVPAMLQMMLAEHGVSAADFDSLRKVVYGGSPISEALLQRGLDVMRCEFAQIYGLTETGNTAVCLPPADHVPGSPRMRAAGRPYPGVRAKVIGAAGNTLPPNEIGEVCIASPASMIEYWGMAEATAKTLVDGWIHSGDAGYLDADGYVYICDRIKDMIIVAGEKVYPAEIENVLCSHPAVAECAVIGVPHERWGEAVLAFVALRAGESLTARELTVWLRGRIADFKIPTRVEFIARVPRNPSGKILRRALRDERWQGMQRQVN